MERFAGLYHDSSDLIMMERNRNNFIRETDKESRKETISIGGDEVIIDMYLNISKGVINK